MLSRLTAEESLLAYERLVIGTGNAEPRARRDMLRRWQRDAHQGRRGRRRMKPSALSAIGIGFTAQGTTTS